MSSCTIRECYATGNVRGTTEVGGLVGKLETGGSAATVSDSYATGVVVGSDQVGGFMGYAINASTARCWCLSPPAAPLGEGGMGPTFAGAIFGASTSAACFWDMTVSGNDGLMTPDAVSAVGKTTVQLQSWNTLEGWDTGTWVFNSSLDTNYPNLIAHVGGQNVIRGRRFDGSKMCGRRLSRFS